MPHADPILEPAAENGRVFDWVPRFDSRSRLYSVSKIVSEPPKDIPSHQWIVPICLDQGSEGACCGFGQTHRYVGTPSNGAATADDAFKLYNLAKTIDEWEGVDYSGTSVLAATKAAQQLDWIDPATPYLWAFSERELAWGIYTTGPAVIGVPWFSGMTDTTPLGTISATGRIIGGHCVCVFGYYTDWPFETGPEPGYLIQNSWGMGWGRYGWCAIRASDMVKLLEDQWAETCLPTPLRGSR